VFVFCSLFSYREGLSKFEKREYYRRVSVKIEKGRPMGER